MKGSLVLLLVSGILQSPIVVGETDYHALAINERVQQVADGAFRYVMQATVFAVVTLATDLLKILQHAPVAEEMMRAHVRISASCICSKSIRAVSGSRTSSSVCT